jgi:ADP-heptose:LPS heptosyltransferase
MPLKKILACRTGAFGDVCMILPLIDALSAHADVHWLIRRGNDAVLKLFPEVRCTPVLFDGALTRSLVGRLDATGYDALLDFSNWDIIARLARRLKSIPLRATAYDQTRFLLRQKVRNSLPWLRPFNHSVRINGRVHRMVKWQTLVQRTFGWAVPLRWTLNPVRRPESTLHIFVHPHASKASKQWPIERFTTVLTELAGERTIRCLVNAGRGGEAEAADRLSAQVRSAGVEAEIVPFDPSLLGLRKAIGDVHVAFGSDSGPLHFAALFGVPSVVVFGPYAPTEVAPLWRSVAAAPAPGGTARDVSPAAALAAIHELLARDFSDDVTGAPAL